MTSLAERAPEGALTFCPAAAALTVDPVARTHLTTARRGANKRYEE